MQPNLPPNRTLLGSALRDWPLSLSVNLVRRMPSTGEAMLMRAIRARRRTVMRNTFIALIIAVTFIGGSSMQRPDRRMWDPAA